MDNRAAFLVPSLFLLQLLMAISMIALDLHASQEPDYRADFHFGSIGINGYVYDSASGEEIPEDEVSFWVLPNSADSVGEVEKIKVEAPGYVPSYVSNFAKKAVNLGFKQLVVFELGRVGLPPANTKRLPKLTIKSKPSGGAVYIDGDYEGRTPIRRLEVKAGYHKIRISKQGYNGWSKELYLNSGEQKTITEKEAKLKRKNKPPEADFVYSPYNPSTEEIVQFASRSQDPDGKIASRHWEFGDGGKDWGEKVSNQYDRQGKYSVTLLVRDDGGATDSVTKNIKVRQPNKPPNADFTYSPSNIQPADVVHFESQATDPDGYISSWSWKFGDGSGSSNRNPDHQYDESGLYTVVLKVKDQGDAKSSIRKKIRVKSDKPNAEFKIKTKNPQTGEEIELDASPSSASNGKIESYQWDFDGDETIDRVLKTPKTTFGCDRPGKYTITLTVTAENGASSSVEKNLNVRKVESKEVKIDEKFALVIGISDYKYDKQYPKLKLKYADKDAQAFYDLLVDKKMGNFSKNRVTLLTNEEATKDKIDESLKTLVTKAESDDLVIIYYSGHGAPGPDYNNDEEDGQDEYYVTYGTDPSTKKTIYKTGYSDDQFADRVKSFQSNQVAVFLDSCYSGGATKSIKGFSLKGYKTPSKRTVFQDFKFEEMEGRILFAASKENQTSYEGEGKEIKHGLFTYFLIKGLKGEADKNHDGSITAQELKGYIVPQVSDYVEEHNLPERTFGGTPQTPLVKGNIAAPLLKKREPLEGTVKYVVGGSKAEEGDRVMIDAGSKDGVNEGDRFRVAASSKGVKISKKSKANLRVLKVVGPKLSLCKVVNSENYVEEGARIFWMENPER